MDYKIGGPTLDYKCPACGNLYFGAYALSSNFFGAIFYSDGSIDGDMVENYPWITECPECKNIFAKYHLLKNENNDESKNRQELMDEFTKSQNIWGRYNKLLKQGNYGNINSLENFIFNAVFWESIITRGLFFPPNTPKKEKNELNIKLHISLWRAYNRSLYNEKIGRHENQISEEGYELFCNKLLTIIKPNSDENLLIIAELYRNIGEFEEAIETLALIKDIDEYKNHIKAIKEAAEKGEKRTVDVKMN